jgi:hypothetical protein
MRRPQIADRTHPHPAMQMKKVCYFLRMPALTSSTAPIAAMMVAMPTGDFCVIPAAGGAAVTAALWTGTCAGALVATGAATDATWWMQ